MYHRADIVLLKIFLQLVALFQKNRENVKNVGIKIRHGRQNYFRIFDSADVQFCNLLTPRIIFFKML